ncbi:MAG: pantoate--beta-alanine ligase [Acidobacteriota bacterium]|jgi:pantoate--beta-alanine ligase|nr:pantoate--beta-alanine ligase [Acidobacteriota bacterium]MDQ3374169.1 pantoate--beta-alanine ligase [Acidobacteriota bacterium]
MEIINRRQRMASLSRKLRRENKTVGFVPTMGALHEGHLSLVKEAKQMCDVVIVSIFVNPAQFNEGDDFNNYPRDLTADAALLTEYQVDYIFAPDTQEIYGENFATYVFVENLTETLEGASRPGHFRGVATVVAILFNTIRPDYAFFGQKDAQQIAVIKRLTQDLGFDTEIVVGQIVREESGLAMSSRNVRLSQAERVAAASIFQGLRAAKIAAREGERSAAKLVEAVRRRIEIEPLAQIDYVAVVDSETLMPIDKIGDNPILVAVAVWFGKTRLIDNTILNRRQ